MQARSSIGNWAEPFSRLPEMLQLFSADCVNTIARGSTGKGAVARPFPVSVDGRCYRP